MEELLHYAWKHKIFPLHELRTPEGEPVEIIDPGLKNTDAGPDFFNAKLRIGETLWVGNVEMIPSSFTLRPSWMRTSSTAAGGAFRNSFSPILPAWPNVTTSCSGLTIILLAISSSPPCPASRCMAGWPRSNTSGWNRNASA